MVLIGFLISMCFFFEVSMVLIGFLISMCFFIFGWFEKSGLDFSGLDFSDQHVFAFQLKVQKRGRFEKSRPPLLNHPL